MKLSIPPRRRIALAGALAALALGATACSGVNTAPDQTALHYSGGSYSSQKFVECFDPGVRKNNIGVDEGVFYYPVGLRTYTFAGANPKEAAALGADAPALSTSTKDQTELSVRGTITFTLNTSCKKYTDEAGRVWPGGILQKFHDTIGRHDGAAATEDGVGPPDGWRIMLAVYMRNVADRAIDNEALKYGWDELYNDASKKAAWERDVVKAIPGLIRKQAGEDYFKIDNILLQKPEIPGALRAQLTDKQAATLRAQTADIDKLTAQRWPGGPAAYAQYQRQQSVNKAIEKGDVKVIPVPDGATLNIPAN